MSEYAPEMRPHPGQVYERDGKRRVVVNSTSSGRCWDVCWRRPNSNNVRVAWCSTWIEWVSKATLVEDGK